MNRYKYIEQVVFALICIVAGAITRQTSIMLALFIGGIFRSGTLLYFKHLEDKVRK